MSDFARTFLYTWLRVPVFDVTGLPGLFDIELSFSGEGLPPLTEFGGAPSFNKTAPSLFTALQEQLGLRLQPARAPIPVLIIDHVGALIEN